MAAPRGKTQWTVVATATAAAATATRAAQAAMRHYITGYSVSMSGATPAVSTFEVRSGANVLIRLELPAAQIAPVDVDTSGAPIECNINETAVANVTAPATMTASVVVRGYTLRE